MAGRPLPRQLQGPRVPVHADHRPLGADQLGHQQGHITDATADVQDPHAAADPGLDQELLGDAAEDRCLLDQPLALLLGVARQVDGVALGLLAHCGASRSQPVLS